MKDSINVFLRVKKKDIYLLCPYFEAFEGMVAIRTPAPELGTEATLKLMLSPDFKDEFDKILAGLKERLEIEQIATI
ncbi:hypothetical protein A2291_07620 [candidate division WOR-1 bacterium RIFOXYB2_FULL_42_35]|uniref:DUF4911 domain-containing protein n=1 Tax=candidate division WOR-1 bacterium RIFOXYC2_FULL_41_25 TaxID=1802586 RepID=A0A1F4TIX8_UNCSA|nr:MAG: hypothetical protein A2247_08145 [candidate division WOR-1 bacterium RIFOXYA2_FULL_41_14]OGC21793.1 MAG: hypothetical protein A2291_07620 [candidate division WOR-1 bacterium RIFOXYB2_FULL_42_35]OGC32691.1 MAG: hypothetical protein A2462_04010 [candidate division WOR-1 bacterium RIFOXYC2_FULL_41_25]